MQRFLKVIQPETEGSQATYKYPYTLEELNRDHPNVSFARNIMEKVDMLAEYDVYPVFVHAIEPYDSSTHTLKEGTIIYNSDLKRYEQPWTTVAKSSEELYNNLKSVLDAKLEADLQAEDERYKHILDAGFALPDRTYTVAMSEADVSKFHQLVTKMAFELQFNTKTPTDLVYIKDNSPLGLVHSEPISYILPVLLSSYGDYVNSCWATHTTAKSDLRVAHATELVALRAEYGISSDVESTDTTEEA